MRQNNHPGEARMKSFISKILERYPNIMDDYKRRLRDHELGIFTEFDLDSVMAPNIRAMYDILRELMDERGIEITED